MKLYMFEHCSLCFRVRMIAALKGLHLKEVVVLDDDGETTIGLVGKRVIPILVKDDGQPMLESMDMVRYIDSIGEAALVGPERTELPLEHFPVDMGRDSRHGAPAWRSDKSLSSYVIPAPLASEASKRDKAGTHAP